MKSGRNGWKLAWVHLATIKVKCDQGGKQRQGWTAAKAALCLRLAMFQTALSHNSYNFNTEERCSTQVLNSPVFSQPTFSRESVGWDDQLKHFHSFFGRLSSTVHQRRTYTIVRPCHHLLVVHLSLRGCNSHYLILPVEREHVLRAPIVHPIVRLPGVKHRENYGPAQSALYGPFVNIKWQWCFSKLLISMSRLQWYEFTTCFGQTNPG